MGTGPGHSGSPPQPPGPALSAPHPLGPRLRWCREQVMPCRQSWCPSCDPGNRHVCLVASGSPGSAWSSARGPQTRSSGPVPTPPQKGVESKVPEGGRERGRKYMAWGGLRLAHPEEQGLHSSSCQAAAHLLCHTRGGESPPPRAPPHRPVPWAAPGPGLRHTCRARPPYSRPALLRL